MMQTERTVGGNVLQAFDLITIDKPIKRRYKMKWIFGKE